MVGDRYYEHYYARDLFFNYTQVVNLYEDEYNFSPRLNYELACTVLNTPDFNWDNLTPMKLVVIDTKREAEIGIGTDWPFEPIPP